MYSLPNIYLQVELFQNELPRCSNTIWTRYQERLTSRTVDEPLLQDIPPSDRFLFLVTCISSPSYDEMDMVVSCTNEGALEKWVFLESVTCP